jgi:NAD(P)-dependent dehydrogenase (short-subunit alcohol dehydrogenase family)
MPTILVTGAGRGIGLALARVYAAGGWRVLATARRPAEVPAVAGDVAWLELDVTQPHSVAHLAAEVDEPLDLLVNNAGIAGQRDTALGAIDYSAWSQAIATNLFGPVRVTEALLPALRQGRHKKVATLSSIMGSIGSNQRGGSYVYRSSKAGLNAVMRSIALDLRAEGFTVVVLHPGWVRTDMGGSAATLEPEASARDLKRLLDNLEPGQTGEFMDHLGHRLPW